jgi:hypothetical protein
VSFLTLLIFVFGLGFWIFGRLVGEVIIGETSPKMQVLHIISLLLGLR